MYHFIVNPHSKSRTSRPLWQALETELTQRGTKYEVHFTKYAGHATRIAAALCAALKNKGCQPNPDLSSDIHPPKRTKQQMYQVPGRTAAPLTIITVGGDGTIHEVINGIPLSCYKQVLLGFIPTGSGNDLAAALKLPSDPLLALDHILCPRRIVRMDHGMLSFPESGTSCRFGVSSGIGYDADICKEVSVSAAKKFLNRLRLGKLIYLVIALKQVLTHKPLKARLIFDGTRQQSGSYLFLAAMNASCEGGGMRLAPGAKMNDRKLSVCVVRDFARPKILILLPALLLGMHTRFSGIDVIDCKTLEIFCQEPATLHADGEFAGRKKHVCYSCAKEQIRIIL